MGLSFTATGATSINPGPHPGRLVSLEKRYKIVQNEGGEREDRPFLRWVFELSEKDFQEKTLSVLSSTSFGVGPGGPSKGRRFAGAILQRELAIGERFEAEDLYDKPVILHVDHEQTRLGTFPRIVEVTAAGDPNQLEIPF